MLFAILKTQKLLINGNLRKMEKSFRQRNHRRTAQRQRAKRFCRTGCNWYPKEYEHQKKYKNPPALQKQGDFFHFCMNLQKTRYFKRSFSYQLGKWSHHSKHQQIPDSMPLLPAGTESPCLNHRPNRLRSCQC